MGSGPRGTVTVLFTDLVASTELWDRLEEEKADDIRRSLFELLRSAITSAGGREVKSLGDGMMAVFASAGEAVDCAVAIQQAVHAYNERAPGREPLRVRVGLNVGEPIREGDDFFGMPVVVARRLCDGAEGGSILASDLVRRLAARRGGRRFRRRPSMQLKGIARPVIVHEVSWEPPTQRPPEEAPGVAAPLPLPSLLAAGERTAFVGRQDEQAALRRCWERALRGQRLLALLAGEPGIGKTRLAIEFAINAHEEGAKVLFGRAQEGSFVPYQPFVDALGQYAAAPGSERKPALEQVAGPAASGELGDSSVEAASEDRRRLAAAITSVLAQAARGGPTVLILDDLQWADGGTLDLLTNVVRGPELATGSLLVIGTYREADITRSHPLSATVANLRRDRLFERISLRGLGAEDVAAMVGAWFGRASAGELAQAVYKQTEGNPFFVEETLRHLTESDGIYDDAGRLAGDLVAAHVPEGVKEVIGQRLARLSEECNSVLAVASVIGRDFGIEALQRASDLPGERLVGALDEAVRAALVRELPGSVGRYGFSHALVHETLYDELTTTRRVRLHGQTLQYADSNGIKLAYEVLGASGPYMVAVGVSNCPAVRTRSLATVRRWEQLTADCRVLLYDRRGVGFSAAPERGYSLLSSVEDLHAVLDAAGIERAILWGATDGGPLAIAFAALYPDRVGGLLLAGTTAKYASDADYPWGVGQAARESFLRTDAVDRGRAVSALTQTRQAGARDAPDVIAEVMRRVPRRAWTKIVTCIGGADVRELLGRVRTPTLIIHDPDNTYIPVQAAQYLHEHIAGSRLLVTEEYGRPLMGEGLCEEIIAFVNKAATSGAA